jgi:hypothetical protein
MTTLYRLMDRRSSNNTVVDLLRHTTVKNEANSTHKLNDSNTVSLSCTTCPDEFSQSLNATNSITLSRHLA